MAGCEIKIIMGNQGSRISQISYIPTCENLSPADHLARLRMVAMGLGSAAAGVAPGQGVTAGVAVSATSGGACMTGGSVCLLLANAIVTSVTSYIAYELLKNVIPVAYTFLKNKYDEWFSIVRYNINDPLVTRALLDELRHQNPHPIRAQVNRNAEGLYWVPSDGWYELRNTTGEYLFDINLSENGTHIDIMRKYTTPQSLQSDINSIYQRRAAGVENISRYSMGQASWMFSGLSPKRRLNQIVQNDAVREVMQRVNTFRADTRPHKTLGLFLEGPTRSGKSTMASVIASEFNLPIYSVSIDSPGLYDGLLEQRIREIPQNSVIVIDEIHLKLNALMVRQNTLVTLGGILEILDDQHIPNGCIVILTAVSSAVVNQIFNNHLIGRGRIDHVVSMNYTQT